MRMELKMKMRLKPKKVETTPLLARRRARTHNGNKPERRR